MKKSAHSMLSMVFIIVLISSCTVSKYNNFSQHRYLDGAKHHKYITVSDRPVTTKDNRKETPTSSYNSPNNLDEIEPIAMAIPSEEAIEIVHLNSIPTSKDSLKTKEYDCDMITLSNGIVQSIKVTHVNHDEIKYKRCNKFL